MKRQNIVGDSELKQAHLIACLMLRQFLQLAGEAFAHRLNHITI